VSIVEELWGLIHQPGGYRFYSQWHQDGLDLKGQWKRYQKLTLINPAGERVSFIGNTLEDACLAAVMLITSEKKTQEGS
jgi:hypothetical protein